MNDIKTIGKKFAKHLVDLNADSFRQQIEDIIKAEQFKAYHFGQDTGMLPLWETVKYKNHCPHEGSFLYGQKI